jgi:hypothetical protein
MKFYPQNTNNYLLIIQSNSPGEVSNWVLPFIKIFKKEVPDSDVVVFLTPCQYSSHEEERLLLESKLVSQVIPPKFSTKHFWSLPFKVPHSYKKGAVMFLGGDPFFSWVLSKKYALPCFGYSNNNTSLGWGYTKTFLKSATGDLMSEKVNQYLENKTETISDKTDILFFTGSRPQHFKAFFPIVVSTIKEIQKLSPKMTIKIHVSPFITDEKLEENLSINPTNIPIFRTPSLDAMSDAKLLITLAGTNTAEATYLNLPMIVLFPLNFPELVILDGLGGLIGQLPIIGTLIKKLILFFMKKTVKFVSHPNRLSNKEIVPEWIGNIEAKTLAKKACTLIIKKEELEKIKRELKEIPHPTEVAKKIITEIVNQSK